MKHAAAPMRDAGGGSIISTSSVGGLEGSTGLFSYCAAKAAVAHLTRCAALEFAQDRFRVNCIAPGLVVTEMLRETLHITDEQAQERLVPRIPLGRSGLPEDCAAAAVFFASPAAEWITGQFIDVAGGE